MKYDFFTINFFPVIGIFFMFVFLWKNSHLEKRIKKMFYSLTLLVIIEDVIYNLELALSTIECSRYLITFVTALGYTLRPMLLYVFIRIILRDKQKLPKLLLVSPIVICAIFSFSAFFTDITYYYDDNLVFHRGILGWTPHLIMLVYLTLMIIFSFTGKGQKLVFERILIIEIVLTLLIATFAESLFGSYVVLRIATTAVLIFYYMFFQSQIYQKEIIQKQKAQIEMTQRFSIQMVSALAGTVDAKDSYTQGHSRRVATYSKEIAVRLGEDEEFCNRIYYIGMLHDIGKIGIPDSILRKDGRLTKDEYDLMKTHPQIGEEVLKNVSEMPTLYYGARWHHERYDGKGYPDGLKGKEIPLEARIVAVADVYDAMTSTRCYRGSLTQEEARQEMIRSKGTQLDPVITDVMISMIDDDKAFVMKEK